MPAEEISPFVAGESNALTGRRNLEEVGGGRLLASAALIGAGILVEPELLGGALLGAGVVYGLPFVSQLLRPVATTAVQLGYSALASVGDLLAGARDQVQGIVATARSDYQRSRGSPIIPGH